MIPLNLYGYLYSSDNGASDWALRLNSYQASNWL